MWHNEWKNLYPVEFKSRLYNISVVVSALNSVKVVDKHQME